MHGPWLTPLVGLFFTALSGFAILSIICLVLSRIFNTSKKRRHTKKGGKKQGRKEGGKEGGRGARRKERG